MRISFTQLNIGCLSRNRYWGELDTQAYRTAKCTSTLISCPEGYLLVDPGVKWEEMKSLLDERCGVDIADVHTVFFTHLHGDHRVDALRYESARLITSQTEIDDLARQGENEELLQRLEPAEEELFPGIRVVSLPGHTKGCSGLAFETEEGPVLIAGDGVMTRDFFNDESGYFNSWNQEEVAKTIKEIKKRYRIIVPGHDIQFYHQEKRT